jgi:hypothetical protein
MRVGCTILLFDMEALATSFQMTVMPASTRQQLFAYLIVCNDCHECNDEWHCVRNPFAPIRNAANAWCCSARPIVIRIFYTSTVKLTSAVTNELARQEHAHANALTPRRVRLTVSRKRKKEAHDTCRLNKPHAPLLAHKLHKISPACVAPYSCAQPMQPAE